jgi:hypothetical protein
MAKDGRPDIDKRIAQASKRLEKCIQGDSAEPEIELTFVCGSLLALVRDLHKRVTKLEKV